MTDTTSACWRRLTRLTASDRSCTAAPGRSRWRQPDYLVSLGRTLSLKANQAVSNISITPYAMATALQELRTGNYDVVHVHEPLAPVAPWCVTDWTPLPVVGTFHTYNENRISNGIANRARGTADAQPPPRPDRRLRGGGVDRAALLRRPLPDHPQRRPRRRRTRRARRAPPADRQAQDRLRRTGGRAQGAAAAAARVRGAARAHPDRAHRDRPLRAGALPADARHARRARARQGRRRDQAHRARGRATCCARRRSAARASAWS